MTILEPYNERLSLNLSSYEQAIAYSASILIVANRIDQNAYDQNFEQSINLEDSEVTFNLSLPISENDYYLNGSSYFDSLGIVHNQLVDYLGEPLPTTTTPIPQEPTEVDTVEKYLIWACFKVLQQRVIEAYKIDAIIIENNFRDSVVNIDITLDIDSEVYAEHQDIVRAVKIFLVENSTPITPNTSRFDNTNRIDNDFSLRN